MKIFLCAFLILSLLQMRNTAHGFDDFEKAREVSLNSSIVNSQTLMGRHFWSSLTYDSNFLSTDRVGTSITLGYQFEFFGVDTRLHLGSSNYGAIKGTPGYRDTPVNDPPSTLEDEPSELRRVRKDEDSWNYNIVEPGFTVRGKWLPFSIEQMTESARVGFGLGKFTDNANAIEFDAYLFSAEAGLSYQIAKTHWSILAAIAWHTGTLILDNEVQSQNVKRLNANWMNSSVGLMYWF